MTSPGKATADLAMRLQRVDDYAANSYRTFLKQAKGHPDYVPYGWEDHADRVTHAFQSFFPEADFAAVRASLMSSKIPETVRQALADGTDVLPPNVNAFGQADMSRWVRTEVTASTNSTTLTTLAAAGYRSKRWVAHHDEATRDTHAAANGQTVLLSATFSVGYANLMYPGDPTAPPNERQNCRCVMVGVDLRQESASNVVMPGPKVPQGRDVSGENVLAASPGAPESDYWSHFDGGYKPTEHQQWALRDYASGTTFFEIRDYWYAGKRWPITDRNTYEMIKGSDIFKELDAALNASKLKSGTTVYRKLALPKSTQIQVGTEIRNNFYVSTAKQLEEAKAYGAAGERSNVTLQIRLPAGHRAVETGFDGEVLLPPTTRFKVISVTQDGTRRLVTVEAVDMA